MGGRRQLAVVCVTVLAEVLLRIGPLRLMDMRVCILVFLGAILANSGTKCDPSAGRGARFLSKTGVAVGAGSDRMTAMISFCKYGAEGDLLQPCLCMFVCG